MYNCTGCKLINNTHGSTKLHMDITDAVNIMVWLEPDSDGEPGTALWHIWSPSASLALSWCLWLEGFNGPGHPVHSQLIYVDEDMHHHLWTKYKVRPHVIYQRPGDAVFIPAGSAHQVRHFLMLWILPSHILNLGC
jgi:lysine-specific demethylase 3